MIRINLLPHRELARAARKRQFGVLAGLALVISVGVVVLGQIVLDTRYENQQARNAYLEQQITQLDAQIGEIRKIKEETQALLARKRVVETLQANRTEVVHLFDQTIRLLPDGLYLKSFKQVGDQITLTGYTQSSARVSTLMRNLEDSEWFERPTLIEIRSATVGGLRANEFSLNVNQTRMGEDKPASGGSKA